MAFKIRGEKVVRGTTLVTNKGEHVVYLRDVGKESIEVIGDNGKLKFMFKRAIKDFSQKNFSEIGVEKSEKKS